MKFIALEHETSTEQADFTPLLKAEAQSTWQMYYQGLLREAYWDTRQHTAVLILECDDENQARSALDNLPLVKAGLISFELIPLAPYDGFKRLFSE